MENKRLEGVFAPLTTPFEDGKVSLELLRANVRKYCKTSLSGFFVLGSNGESKSLSKKEKVKVLEAVLEEKADHQHVMAGCGYESTRQTIEFSKWAASAGVDFVSVLTPSYFKKTLTDDAMVGYYQDVADALSIPVLVYNAPGFTGLSLSAGVVQKISRHPNIVGMKDTSPANMSSYLAVSGDSFDVLSGTISTLFPALMLGASGGVVSLANAFPEICCTLFDICQQGDIPGARELHYRLFKLNQSVSGSFGVAGVKQAMTLGGFFGGDPRLPLLPLSEDSKKFIGKAVTAAGINISKQDLPPNSF
jgi:4-hydroxy-2-oxoglutarate aldolase